MKNKKTNNVVGKKYVVKAIGKETVRGNEEMQQIFNDSCFNAFFVLRCLVLLM
jgi:hypothetical protein